MRDNFTETTGEFSVLLTKQSQVTKAVASQVWGRLGALKIFDLRMREAAALMPVTRDCVIHSPFLLFCYHTKGNV